MYIYRSSHINKYTLINIHMQEDYSKDFEEKKSELQAKVIEIYEASTAEIKVVIYFNNFSHFQIN